MKPGLHEKSYIAALTADVTCLRAVLACGRACLRANARTTRHRVVHKSTYGCTIEFHMAELDTSCCWSDATRPSGSTGLAAGRAGAGGGAPAACRHRTVRRGPGSPIRRARPPRAAN